MLWLFRVFHSLFSLPVIIRPKTLIIHILWTQLLFVQCRKCFVEIHIEQIVQFENIYSEWLREIKSVIMSCVKWLAGIQCYLALKNLIIIIIIGSCIVFQRKFNKCPMERTEPTWNDRYSVLGVRTSYRSRSITINVQPFSVCLMCVHKEKSADRTIHYFSNGEKSFWCFFYVVYSCNLVKWVSLWISTAILFEFSFLSSEIDFSFEATESLFILILKRKSRNFFYAAIEMVEPSIDYPPNAECSLTHLAPCFELYVLCKRSEFKFERSFFIC